MPGRRRQPLKYIRLLTDTIHNIADIQRRQSDSSWVFFFSGLHHVNNRPLEYVLNALDSLGFTHDPEASKAVRAACRLNWLRNNVNVFRRKPTNTLDSEFL